MRWCIKYRAICHGVCRDYLDPGKFGAYATKPTQIQRVVEMTPDAWIEDERAKRQMMLEAPEEALAAVAPYTDAVADEILEIYALRPMDAEAHEMAKGLSKAFALMVVESELKPVF